MVNIPKKSTVGTKWTVIAVTPLFDYTNTKSQNQFIFCDHIDFCVLVRSSGCN